MIAVPTSDDCSSLQVGTEGLVVVSDFFDVFRLYQTGDDNAVALMGTDLSDRQRLLLLTVLGESAKITLLLRRETPETVEIISKLIGTFFVQLVRTEVSPGDLPSDRLPELLSGAAGQAP
jgi:hypothetical protein